MSRIRDEILQTSEISEGKYWATSRSGESRLDLRFSSGARVSVQYHSIQKFEFFPEFSETGEDLMVIDITGVSRFEIFGTGLSVIYEALNRSSVRFIAMATDHEDSTNQDGVRVSVIREFTAEELQEAKIEAHGQETSENDAIEAFLNSLSDEEAGEFTAEAYREAEERGEGIETNIEKWNAVASKVVADGHL